MADVEEIKKRLDIVQIIGEYITLKKAGVTYKALCPFHNEKTPSFTVSPDRASWHCFGCSEGGDVISFVQKIDGLDFREALEKLASRAGVELEPLKPEQRQAKSDKGKVLEIMEMATRLYHEILLQHRSAEAARLYIKKRGISDDMVSQFRIGYAPNAWHTIDHALAKKNISHEWAWKSGLSVQKGADGSYDRFRDRLMFPIDDSGGKIIGFTGRIISEIEGQAKYVNTSESAAFKKSDAVYGLSYAKSGIREQRVAVIVEGQMDVITAHQYGFTNTVATSGTALTEGHLRLLKRYTENIAFAFDNDSAGLKAARAATLIAFSLEMNPLIVRITGGKDPDEVIRHDKAAWDLAVKSAVPAIDYFLDLAVSDPTPLNALRKKDIAGEISSLIKMVKNAVEQSEYIHRLSLKLGIAEASIVSDLKSRDSNSTVPPALAQVPITEMPLLDLERLVIGLCIAYPSLLPPLPGLRFENTALQSLYETICGTKEKGGAMDSIMATLPRAWQTRLNAILAETLRRHEQLEAVDIAKEIIDCLDRMASRDREARIATHAQAIAQAFSAGDKAKARQLLKSLDSDTITEE